GEGRPREECAPERRGSADRVAAGGGCEGVRRRATVERERLAANPRHDPGREDGGGDLHGPSHGRADRERRQRKESDAGDRGQQRPQREQKPARRLTPGKGEQAEGGGSIENRRPESEVPERQHGNGQCEGKSRPGPQGRGSGRKRRQAERPAARIEGEGRRCPAGVEGREQRRGQTAGDGQKGNVAATTPPAPRLDTLEDGGERAGRWPAGG